MKREFLKTLGLDDELINQIMVEHGKALTSITTLTGQVETLTAEKAALTTQIAERDEQLTTLKDAAKDSETLTQQIADLQAANQTSQTNSDAQIAKIKKDYEVKIALDKVGALNSKATLALLDLDTVKVNDDGSVTGLTEQLDKVKEENPFLFKADEAVVEDSQKPVITANQNSNADGQIVDPFEAILQKYQ